MVFFNDLLHVQLSNLEHIHQEQEGSVIRYSPQHDRDYGSLICWATNEIGEQRDPCVYRVFQGGISTLILSTFIRTHILLEIELELFQTEPPAFSIMSILIIPQQGNCCLNRMHSIMRLVPRAEDYYSLGGYA